MAEATAGAFAFAASAGVATFFAPCAFPLLPGYVGYYLRESDGDSALLPAAGAAAVGALGALAAVTALVLAVGRPVTTALPVFEPVVGVGLVGFGLLTLWGWWPELRVSLPARPTSVTGFAVFGAVYALAAAGCVVPLFVGVLTQALALSLAEAIVVLGVYAAGVTVPLVGVTLLVGVGVDVTGIVGTRTTQIRRLAAVVMILAGLGQLYLSVVTLDVFGFF